MKLTARDLIQTGIFTAVYLVVYMVFNVVGALLPLLQLLAAPFAILINGITFMVFLSRVRKPAAIIVMTVLLAVIMVVMGHHPITFATAAVGGGLATWLSSVWPVDRTAKSVLTYAFFSLWPVGAFLPLLFMRDTVINQTASQMGPDWAQTYNRLMSAPMIGVLTVLCFIAGVIGGFLGRAVLKRSFRRAGLA